MLGRLEGAVKTLSQFAADASHELRTPLAVIRTSAELALRRARTPESYRESLREISDEAERMTRLVEDLLFLARNEAHGKGGQEAEMPRVTLNIGDLLRDVAGELRSIADVRGIHIRIAAPDFGSRPPLISGNAAALRRLFLVLIDNAIKYSRAGSEVVVAIGMQGEGVVVTVRDFGIGIGSADLPHIFKRFYQADPARNDGGFGLGLSLAETIANAHGASLDVESQEGSGSIFRVAFSGARFGDLLLPKALLPNTAETIQRKLEIPG
jgi:signal transduction histidine kinase